MAHAVTIYLPEMREILEKNGFKQMGPLPNTKEIVFGKRVNWERHEGDRLIYSLPLTIRVYTSIVTSGTSRGVGEDAIRVSVWIKREQSASNNTQTKIWYEAFMVGGSKRVHRVENWRNNLQQRLDNWTECLQPLCPECGAPMLLKTSHVNPPRFEPFYGCVRFPDCRGTGKSNG